MRFEYINRLEQLGVIDTDLVLFDGDTELSRIHKVFKSNVTDEDFTNEAQKEIELYVPPQEPVMAEVPFTMDEKKEIEYQDQIGMLQQSNQLLQSQVLTLSDAIVRKDSLIAQKESLIAQKDSQIVALSKTQIIEEI